MKRQGVSLPWSGTRDAIVSSVSSSVCVGAGPAAIAPSGPALPQQPTVADPNPLQLRPPAAQPASLPPPPAVQAPAAQAIPTVPMVPAGQVALMVSARFGRDPPNIAAGLHW